MFCHICLKEEVEGKVDRLEVCKNCLKKIKPYWEKEYIQKMGEFDDIEIE